MRPSSSTMTPAHTAIDSGKQYIMMSPELADAIEFEDEKKARTWSARIQIDGSDKDFYIISIEASDSGYVLCVSVGDEIQSFAGSLLKSLQLTSIVSGESFKSKVLKLESDKAYLKLLR